MKQRRRADLRARNGDQPQSLREINRDVLHGVDRDISAILKQCQLQLFHEQAFAAHFRQRCIKNDIAARDHRHQLDPQAFMAGFEALLNIMCLPEREGALACGNS